MPEFFTNQTALNCYFEDNARRHQFRGTTRDDVAQWQAQARARLSEILGLPLMQNAPPLARLRASVREADGLLREEWLMQTEPEVWMPYTLLIPDGIETPAPLVFAPHGHGGGGKWMVTGRRDNALVASGIERFNGDYGLQLARAGFIVAAPDGRGFGERREPAVQGDEDVLKSSCAHLTLSGSPLGLTVQGMMTWDLMRLLDWLQDDPRVDATRVGSAGLSGGGQQTLNFAALDTRVKASVVSGYFYGARESLLQLNRNCLCNMVPDLWSSFDMGDVAGLITPRGLFIETGDADPLNGASGLDNVYPQVEIANRVFELAGESVQHDVVPGPHRWNGRKSVPWLQEQLAA